MFFQFVEVPTHVYNYCNYYPLCKTDLAHHFVVPALDPQRHFCSLATRSFEERMIWIYQSKSLMTLCFLILADCDEADHEYVLLSSLAMRLLVTLTDVKGWKYIADDSLQEGTRAVKELVQFMGSTKSGMYICIRKYISRLDAPFLNTTGSSQKDDKFLIIASAITLALRPFHNLDMGSSDSLDLQAAAEQYCVFLLTIPWFVQRLPAVLLSPLRHKSILSPCFRAIMVRLMKWEKLYSYVYKTLKCLDIVLLIFFILSAREDTFHSKLVETFVQINSQLALQAARICYSMKCAWTNKDFRNNFC